MICRIFPFMRQTVFLFVVALWVLPTWAQLRLPQYQSSQLPNGVKVIVMPKRDVPLVTLKVLVKGGGEADPADKAGLADVTNDLMLRGTTKRSATEIADQLDFLGASISTSSDYASNTVTLEVLSKDVATGVKILADIVLQANFPKDEVAKELASALDSAKSLKDSPQAAVHSYATKYFFNQAGHPYGKVADETTLARIFRDDIVSFHKRYYVGANMTVIAVGDFESEAMQRTISEAFAKAPKGTAFQAIGELKLSRESEPRMLFINDAQATQTQFYIMQPGISIRNPDRIAVMLVNTLFGGRFTSMLNDALRVNAGLTYGATSSVQERQLEGMLAISTFTATKTTEQAIDMALDVLKTLREKGINAEQLESAKAYVKGGMPTKLLETNDQLASLLAKFEINGLDSSEVDTLFQRIDAVSVEDANRVIERYYRADNLTFVLLGQYEAIGKQVLSKYAKEPVVVELRSPGLPVSAQ
jgi:zinc protease